jgi:hypothetical protein
MRRGGRRMPIINVIARVDDIAQEIRLISPDKIRFYNAIPFDCFQGFEIRKMNLKFRLVPSKNNYQKPK